MVGPVQPVKFAQYAGDGLTTMGRIIADDQYFDARAKDISLLLLNADPSTSRQAKQAKYEA